MKIFDYFYKEVLNPTLEQINETFFALIDWMLNGLLALVLWVTIPIWIIPYLIIKHRKGKKHD